MAMNRSRGLPICRGTLLYIAGPITPSYQYPDMRANVDRAREVGLRWFKRGYSVFIPHCNNDGWKGVLYEEYMETGLCILAKCEGIVMMKGWEWSKGAVREHDRANQLGKVVFFDEYFTKYNEKE